MIDRVIDVAIILISVHTDRSWVTASICVAKSLLFAVRIWSHFILNNISATDSGLLSTIIDRRPEAASFRCVRHVYSVSCWCNDSRECDCYNSLLEVHFPSGSQKKRRMRGCLSTLCKLFFLSGHYEISNRLYLFDKWLRLLLIFLNFWIFKNGHQVLLALPLDIINDLSSLYPTVNTSRDKAVDFLKNLFCCLF